MDDFAATPLHMRSPSQLTASKAQDWKRQARITSIATGGRLGRGDLPFVRDRGRIAAKRHVHTDSNPWTADAPAAGPAQTPAPRCCRIKKSRESFCSSPKYLHRNPSATACRSRINNEAKNRPLEPYSGTTQGRTSQRALSHPATTLPNTTPQTPNMNYQTPGNIA